ncbi:MAG: hypothetical protein EA362_02820 [Saprospirales bacterium]|nr:MAG: hypothetical protein EA362_02820 [Saprospirales bacterium]
MLYHNIEIRKMFFTDFFFATWFKRGNYQKKSSDLFIGANNFHELQISRINKRPDESSCFQLPFVKQIL